MSRGLFDAEGEDAPRGPLAERMRPTSLDDFIGQAATAPGSLLRRLLDEGRLSSLLLWGPPGTGKTTLARILARHTDQAFVDFSAVLSGVKEVREIVRAAERRRYEEEVGTLLFVDEIHRFNRAQQDAFLPHVERGTVTLVGATTENPSFHLNAALLSRCLPVVLEPLGTEALVTIARRALADRERGVGHLELSLDDAGLQRVAETSHGDARAMLNRIEALALAARSEGLGGAPLEEEALTRLLADKRVYHDRSGEQHYDLISALHKSIRGGDPQAALYWLARMIEGGEEPLYLARRLVRIASEDIGLADPQALPAALAAMEAFRFLGSPEGELALAQVTVHLATAPKSNAVYQAFGAVREEIQAGAVHGVPHALRNAPTRFMKQLGYGRGYEYPHDLDDGVAGQDYLPEELSGRRWYEPAPFGHEKEIRRRMDWWDDVRARLRGEAPAKDEESDDRP